MAVKYLGICFIDVNGKKLELELGDFFTNFLEHSGNDLLLVGVRRANKKVKEINSNKRELKNLEKRINDFYGTNYELDKAYVLDIGYLWNYKECYYYFPE